MPRDFTPEALRLLHRYGYQAAKVERYDSFRQRSRDFLGFADIIAYRAPTLADPEILNPLNPLYGTLYLQICSRGSMAAHVDKVTSPPISTSLADCLLSGNRFELWAFPHRTGTRGHRLQPIRRGNRTHYQLKMSFLQLSYDPLTQTFFTEDTTELTHLGYVTS